MTLIDMLLIYDNRNGTIVINDNSLKYITKDIAFELISKLPTYLLESKVISFGFYDQELCIRIDY